MFTGPVGPVEVFFYWPEAIFGDFYWPGAIGPLLASSPDVPFESHIKGSDLWAVLRADDLKRTNVE